MLSDTLKLDAWDLLALTRRLSPHDLLARPSPLLLLILLTERQLVVANGRLELHVGFSIVLEVLELIGANLPHDATILGIISVLEYIYRQYAHSVVSADRLICNDEIRL